MNTMKDSKTETMQTPTPGMLMDLTKVPDPVFSSKMMGDGFAIDPVFGVLVAPISGEVASLHASKHAVSLRREDGVEVLMHIGLETVHLKGEGFQSFVKVGDKVQQGDELIRFDMDFVAQNAKSLLTLVVFTNMDAISDLSIEKEAYFELGQNVCSFKDVSSETLGESESREALTSETIQVVNKSGIHARPAANLVNVAKKYKSKLEVCSGKKKANGRSVVSILGIELAYQDEVYFKAEGPDASDLLKEIVSAVNDGLGEEPHADIQKAPEPQQELSKKDDPENIIRGVGASSGLAYGRVVQVSKAEIKVPEKGGDAASENKLLLEALKTAKLEIDSMRKKLDQQGDKDKGAIFNAHLELLEDPDLLESFRSKLAEGYSAAFSWQFAYLSMSERLAALKNELLAARANDINDVGMRVLRLLVEVKAESIQIPDDSILIADDLTPSETINLDKKKVLGFCTLAGGSSSHVAILARSLGIPAIAGIDKKAMDLANGTLVILNGSEGVLDTQPTDSAIETAKKQLKKEREQHKLDLAKSQEKAVTTDGHKMLVFANIGNVKDAEEAVQLGAEGVGLLRSEFLFMHRDKEPSVKQQQDIYEQMTSTLGSERPLIIRTLDVGGDKPLDYLSFPKEENPFLGLRGIRVGLDQPKILREQVQAILKSSQNGNVAIMFPMIGFINELREGKKIVEEERLKLGLDKVPVGMMIEVPSAALCADKFAKEVDFFSIGSNDLTQYALAIDRGHTELASKVDGLHPAVLKLIELTSQAGHRYDKMVAVCGGLASDPEAIPVLIGLGVEELSVSCPMIPRVKSDIRRYSKADCESLAQKALEMESAEEVRSLCKEFMERHN